MSIREEIEKLTAPQTVGQDEPSKNPPPPTPQQPQFFNFGKIGQAMVPFTPVPFAGSGALYAWGRVIVYGTLAAATWKKNKTVAYIAAASTAISIASSLAAKSWE